VSAFTSPRLIATLMGVGYRQDYICGNTRQFKCAHLVASHMFNYSDSKFIETKSIPDQSIRTIYTAGGRVRAHFTASLVIQIFHRMYRANWFLRKDRPKVSTWVVRKHYPLASVIQGALATRT